MAGIARGYVRMAKLAAKLANGFGRSFWRELSRPFRAVAATRNDSIPLNRN